MFELSIQTQFSAAHRLAGYEGDCARLHGHNWDVRVSLRGHDLDQMGVLVDFRTVKQATQQALKELDHRDLSELPAFRGGNPTSEHIALYLHKNLSAALNCERFTVYRVRVSETASTSAAYWEE